MKTKSFTLIELLVVIVIIGILAGVITLSVTSNINKAKDLKVSSSIISISKALKADSYESFPIEVAACNLKNSCTTLKSRIDLPNITEDIYYKSSSSGEFFVIYGNKPSNTLLGYEITSIDENVKEVPSFDNLVAYYPLSTGTKNGTAISDMSPNSNNGTNSGASSTSGADGNIGTAMSFDGINDYIDCGNGASLNPVNEITISMWIKPSSLLPSQERHIIEKDYAVQWEISTFGDELKVNIKIEGVFRSNYLITTDANLILANWYFVVFTYNGETGKLYCNNVEVASNNLYPGVIGTGDKSLLIGKRFSSSFFDGSIDDVRIYNRALTQEEITLLYNK